MEGTSGLPWEAILESWTFIIYKAHNTLTPLFHLSSAADKCAELVGALIVLYKQVGQLCSTTYL